MIDLSYGWQARAACRTVPNEVFYPPDSEGHRSRQRMVARAKAICRSCPVMERCREYALQTGEQYGVWGGLSERERQQLIA